jgi:hypothetical protein
MSYLAKAALCATALCAPLLLGSISAQAVPAGSKSLPRFHGTILVKRECIRYERDDEGVMRCVEWAECGPTCADRWRCYFEAARSGSGPAFA